MLSDTSGMHRDIRSYSNLVASIPWHQFSEGTVRRLGQCIRSYGNLVASIPWHQFSEGTVRRLGQCIINLSKKMIELQENKK